MAKKRMEMKIEFKDKTCTITSSFTETQDYLDLVTTLKVAKEKDLEILLNIKASLLDFQKELGIACASVMGMPQMLAPDIFKEQDEYVYQMIGRMTLDTYITNTYYIKSKADKTVYEIKGDNYESKIDTTNCTTA